MGNHLLENGFSLLFGGFYFKDDQLYEKARKIITEQLEEQILDDGGHFELSPMYQQIILDRMLDCINLLQNNNRFDDQEPLLQLMKEKAEKTIKWLLKITFANGQIPLLNDSAPGIAPTTKQLKNYASHLDIISDNSYNLVRRLTDSWALSDSGYRKYSTPHYECIIDIGHIGPNYIPGHAHADTFNFVLYISKNPFIVDTGISSYEKNSQRYIERSTISHNTVEINDNNSSDVWGGFRVGKRVKPVVIKDDSYGAAAYYRFNKFLIHKRAFQFEKSQIIIADEIIEKKKVKCECKAAFHFPPGVDYIQENNSIQCPYGEIRFSNADQIKKSQYFHAEGMNIQKEAPMLIVFFTNKLTTHININHEN